MPLPLPLVMPLVSGQGAASFGGIASDSGIRTSDGLTHVCVLAVVSARDAWAADLDNNAAKRESAGTLAAH